MSETAIETIPAPAPEPLALCLPMMPSETMKPILAEYVDRRRTFREWLLSQLVMGVHFGTPPGCEPDTRINPLQWKAKPSLYKAGADFICDLLQMDPRFSPDVEAWKMLGANAGTVVMKCELISRENNPFFRRPSGAVLGEGRGAGVAGVKKRDGNGAVKIAQKSAKIDAVINALGLSDLFTQDQVEPAQPGAAPTANPESPRVQPRDQRTNIPTVVGELNSLWKHWWLKFHGTKTEFEAWAQQTLDTQLDLSKPANWGLDAVEVCRQALAEKK